MMRWWWQHLSKARRCSSVVMCCAVCASQLQLPMPAPHLLSPSTAVSGPGAYGGLQAPAEDDTGVRPGSGSSGQEPGPAAPAHAPKEQSGKLAYVQQRYGGAAETGVASGETTAATGGGSEAAQGAPKLQADQLTVLDDDA